jgi:hypothetical protein
LRRHGPGAARSAQPLPVSGRHWARQGAHKLAVVADDGHLGAVHPERDALAGECVADIQLCAGEADAVDLPLDADTGPLPDGRGEDPAGRAPPAARRASSVIPSRPRRGASTEAPPQREALTCSSLAV